MELVLGIDLGTTYFKLGLFDRQGQLRGLGRVAVSKQEPQKGWCELPVGRFWSTLKEGLTQTLEQAQAETNDIQAVSYSSQANSFLLLDRNDQPLTPLILWPDCRVEKVDQKLSKLWSRQDFLEVTGIGFQSPQSCIAKLLWFQKERPDIWSQTARVMTISDYLTFGLTGQYLGDQGTASLLGILDLRHGQWWGDALDCLHLTQAQLSRPLSPASFAGPIISTGVKLLGLPADIPFVVGSLDHHMAAIGAGVGPIADFSESTGTVMACLNYQQTYQPHLDCCMGPAHTGKGFYQLAFNPDGTGTLDWYKRVHASNLTFDELSQQAQGVSPGSEGLLARPQAHTYPGLTGFENYSDGHHHGHFVRAIMEQKARSLKELIHRLCGEKNPRRIIATGGGSKSDLWLQIKAEIIEAEFVVTSCEEPACMGAAMFAALAKNWYRNDQAISEAWITIKKLFKG